VPLLIVRNDITKMKCDAIVNPTNEMLLPGGGVDEAIHAAAGVELFRACKKIGVCSVGGAVITPAFKLSARFVIHTVGPIWQGGNRGEREALVSAYRSSLALARDNGCKSVAVPLISSGSYGYPKDEVLRVAINAITEFLFDNDMAVYLVVFDRTSYALSEKLFSSVKSYIDDNYADIAAHGTLRSITRAPTLNRVLRTDGHAQGNAKPQKRRRQNSFSGVYESLEVGCSVGLQDRLDGMDASFSDMLLSLIDKKGMTDVECYKRANVDKKVFSKIRCNKGYRPSKPTALSFALALRLNIDETNTLLRTLGMSLSHSFVFDVVIEYFIINGIYDFATINEVLFELDQQTLGCIEN